MAKKQFTIFENSPCVKNSQLQLEIDNLKMKFTCSIGVRRVPRIHLKGDVSRGVDPFFGLGGKTTKRNGVLGEGAKRPSGGWRGVPPPLPR